MVKIKRIEKIEKFEKVINENKSGMLQIIILYNMSCYDNYTNLNDIQKEKILSFIYTLYLKDETKTDLAIFSDTVMNNCKKILNDEITRQNIYDFLEV